MNDCEKTICELYDSCPSNYQINSIAAQREMIADHKALGTYTLDEIEMHFSKRKFDYIAFDQEITLSYGYLKKVGY